MSVGKKIVARSLAPLKVSSSCSRKSVSQWTVSVSENAGKVKNKRTIGDRSRQESRSRLGYQLSDDGQEH